MTSTIYRSINYQQQAANSDTSELSTTTKVPNMSSIAEQIQEYKSQLSDVESLLQATPDDPSLLSLKTDLIDLINITRQQEETPLPSTAAVLAVAPETITNGAGSVNVFDRALEAAVGKSVGREEQDLEVGTSENMKSFAETIIDASNDADQSTVPHSIDTVTASEPAKKKQKIFKAEFEVPQHLIPLETDTEAERNKKQRSLKALKSKWRESKKEMESTNKQKSWQSFQKKTKVKSTSIFKTGDSAVGVVSAAGRQLTDYASRSRHKHEPN
jgi:survival of motor neuron-related-splicing factor 30